MYFNLKEKYLVNITNMILLKEDVSLSNITIEVQAFNENTIGIC